MAGVRPPPDASARYSEHFGEGRFGAHRLVVDLVGTGHHVLDVGCGEGALSERIAKHGNDVVGIEADRQMAEAARRRGVAVHVRNLESDSLDDLGLFDTVVCADVLEHLVDPAAALLKLRGRLSAGGRLVCSIPNVAFYSVRLRLLAGKFEYTNGGTLDRTHFRFFTHRTARALLSSAGFSIAKEEVTHYLPLGVPPLTRAFNQLIERTWFGSAVHRACLAFPGPLAYQFVTVSTRDA